MGQNNNNHKKGFNPNQKPNRPSFMDRIETITMEDGSKQINPSYVMKAYGNASDQRSINNFLDIIRNIMSGNINYSDPLFIGLLSDTMFIANATEIVARKTNYYSNICLAMTDYYNRTPVTQDYVNVLTDIQHKYNAYYAVYAELMNYQATRQLNMFISHLVAMKDNKKYIN